MIFLFPIVPGRTPESSRPGMASDTRNLNRNDVLIRHFTNVANYQRQKAEARNERRFLPICLVRNVFSHTASPEQYRHHLAKILFLLL